MFIQQWNTVKWGWLGKKSVAVEAYKQVSVSRSNHGWQVRWVWGDAQGEMQHDAMFKQRKAQINTEGRTASLDEWIQNYWCGLKSYS